MLELLRRYGVAFCISDDNDAPSPWPTPTEFAYVRGHGPSGRYHGAYSDAELALWADRIGAWRALGRDASI